MQRIAKGAVRSHACIKHPLGALHLGVLRYSGETRSKNGPSHREMTTFSAPTRRLQHSQCSTLLHAGIAVVCVLVCGKPWKMSPFKSILLQIERLEFLYLQFRDSSSPQCRSIVQEIELEEVLSSHSTSNGTNFQTSVT